jgi:6,7-dimethyl-8-ribityllumazine synthase
VSGGETVKQAPSGVPSAQGLRVAVLYAGFNPRVVDGLLEGACEALDAMEAAEVRRERVPGAFELPLAAKAAAIAGFDAVVALGAVIRGETDHYEHIAREAASGLAAVALETGVPVGFGVLTVADEAQALARSAPGPENKGAEAARAAIAMVHVLERLRETKSTIAATPATKTQRTQRVVKQEAVRRPPRKSRRNQ